MSCSVWIENVGSALKQNDPKRLETLFARSNDALALEIANMSKKSIGKLVESKNVTASEWLAMDGVMISYLVMLQTGSREDHLEFLSSLQVAFSSARAAVLTRIVATWVNIVCRYCMALGRDNTGRLSAVLLKLFNSVRSDRTDMQGLSSKKDFGIYKKDIILQVGIKLCQLYFVMGQPWSCANVFSNMHTARLSFSRFPLSQRVAYRVYLGRFYLLRNQLIPARKHLLWAFDHCRIGTDHKRMQRILQYLIPASLLLGYLPQSSQAASLGGQFPEIAQFYGPMIYHLRAGDYSGYQDAVETHRQFLRKRGLYLLLRANGTTLVFRQLFLRVHQALGTFDLPFDAILTGLRFSTRRGYPGYSTGCGGNDGTNYNWDTDDVIDIASSLIDQGYLAANIYVGPRTIRTRKELPFPPISQAITESHAGIADESWLDQ